MIELLFFKTKDINRSGFIWNAIAGSITGLQSVIFLVVVSRTTGVENAGIFSIAWAIANLALALGKYGMRNYQVTDVTFEYSIETYFNSRIITGIAMLLMAAIYVVYGRFALGYDTYKCEIIICICVMKLVDAVEDIFHGWFQQCGRLDVASKANSLRNCMLIAVYVSLLYSTKNLIVPTLISTLASITFFCSINFPIASRFRKTGIQKIDRNVWRLLYSCIPLCTISFFSIYIGNAPQYAIDACLDEKMQAHYNYIFMPVFAIGLFAGFAFIPVLTEIGKSWENKNYKTIKKISIRQGVIIISLTVFAVVVANTIGIPILSWIYSEELSQYKTELTLLMIGGGALAYTYYFSALITAMRRQWILAIIYCAVTVIEKIVTRWFVVNYALLGAGLAYTASMMLLAIVMGVSIVIIICKQGQNSWREQ